MASARYYSRYTCRAENRHGLAHREVELAEASSSGDIQQAVLDKRPPRYSSALCRPHTEATCRCMPSVWSRRSSGRTGRETPGDECGRPPGPPVAVNTGNTDPQLARYLLEDLRPQTTYHLRFAARNRVGFSKWEAQQQVTTGRRGRPEPPFLNTGQLGEGGEEGLVVRWRGRGGRKTMWPGGEGRWSR